MNKINKRRVKTGHEFLTYLKTIYINAPYDSKGGQLYQAANSILFPNGQPQISLMGYFVMEEALAYNDLLGDRVDLKSLDKIIKETCI